MKKVIAIFVFLVISTSSFAETGDIACGVVKKITTDYNDGPRIEFTNGGVVKSVILDSFNSPFIAASLTSNITVCFKEYGTNSIFSVSK